MSSAHIMTQSRHKNCFKKKKKKRSLSVEKHCGTLYCMTVRERGTWVYRSCCTAWPALSYQSGPESCHKLLSHTSHPAATNKMFLTCQPTANLFESETVRLASSRKVQWKLIKCGLKEFVHVQMKVSITSFNQNDLN